MLDFKKLGINIWEYGTPPACTNSIQGWFGKANDAIKRAEEEIKEKGDTLDQKSAERLRLILMSAERSVGNIARSMIYRQNSTIRFIEKVKEVLQEKCKNGIEALGEGK